MMDTQPLLRVNTIKPQSSQPAPVRSNDSASFEQQLQDRIQQTETAEAQPKKDASGEKCAETPASETVEQQQTEADATAEITAVNVHAETSDHTGPLAEDAELTASLVVMQAVDTDQILPQDGNALPLLFADVALIPMQNMAVDSDELPEVMAGLINGQAIHDQERMQGKSIVAVSLSDAGNQALAAVENQIPTVDESLATDLSLENMPLPELKLQVKASDMLNDKQIAALVNDFNKSAAVSMQQVQAITGSAAVNIQTYVPPQFDALQTVASGFQGNISTPVNHPAWGQQLGQQMAFMIQGNVHSAEIKLNPAHLGPMEIHLSLKDDQASVTFVSAHAPVREALDAAIPRLRDMLEQQGLNLANVDVSAHSGGQRHAPEQQAHQLNSSVSGEEDHQSVSSAARVTSRIETGLSVFV